MATSNGRARAQGAAMLAAQNAARQMIRETPLEAQNLMAERPGAFAPLAAVVEAVEELSRAPRLWPLCTEEMIAIVAVMTRARLLKIQQLTKELEGPDCRQEAGDVNRYAVEVRSALAANLDQLKRYRAALLALGGQEAVQLAELDQSMGGGSHG